MWSIIAVIVVVFFLKVLWGIYKQNKKIAKEGGMVNKYSRLISRLLQLDSRNKIYKVSPDSVTLGVKDIMSSTLFTITQTMDIVTFQWEVNSVMHGKYNLEMKFNECSDQDFMYEELNKEVGQHLDNMRKIDSRPTF